MGTDRPRRILILGGGFGGFYTALELEKAMARDSCLDHTC
jgi:NADH dehydrogenase FAD-containing subunit